MMRLLLKQPDNANDLVLELIDSGAKDDQVHLYASNARNPSQYQTLLTFTVRGGVLHTRFNALTATSTDLGIDSEFLTSGGKKVLRIEVD